MTREYFQVPVAEVIRETDEACSLVLDVPASLATVFAYRPGQFVTVRVPSERCGSVARCYSLSSSPPRCPWAGPARWSRGAAACGTASTPR